MINLLMMNKEEVEAPAGSSMIEQLKQHVENYCLGRATSGSTREDLESGNVWNNKDIITLCLVISSINF